MYLMYVYIFYIEIDVLKLFKGTSIFENFTDQTLTFSCKIRVVLIIQNYMCFYTLKVRAIMYLSIAQYVTRTKQNFKIELNSSVGENIYLIHKSSAYIIRTARVFALLMKISRNISVFL